MAANAEIDLDGLDDDVDGNRLDGDNGAEIRNSTQVAEDEPGEPPDA